MKNDRYHDILTGVVVGATVGVFFPLTPYMHLLVLGTVIVGLRLLLAAK